MVRGGFGFFDGAFASRGWSSPPLPRASLSLVRSRAQAQLPGAPAPATEEPFSSELKLTAGEFLVYNSRTLDPQKPLLRGRWPQGFGQ